MIRQALLLLGLLTAADGFGISLSVSRIESRLAKTIPYAKPPEFTVEDDDDVRPTVAQVKRSRSPPPEFTIEDDNDDYVPRSSPVKRSRSPPPEFTIEDDNDDYVPRSSPKKRSRSPPPEFTIEDDNDGYVPRASPVKKSRSPPPKLTVKKDDSDYSYSESRPESKSIRRPKRKTIPSMKGTSWMEKNAQFSNEVAPEKIEEQPPRFNPRDSPLGGRGPAGRGSFNSRDSPRGGRGGPSSRDGGRGPPSNNFRQNFRATRVFVQGIPPGTSWQDLKDHFKVAGDVVFASVSVDIETGESRGHGIVQFEEPEMAENAIKIMRDHPLDGSALYVREDVQENKNGAEMKPKGPTPPTKWKCANEDNAAYLDEAEIMAIRNLIKARDDARRRRKYDVSDSIRDQLKETHGVFIDDRLQMWWTSVDGSKVPKSIHEIKGDGRWKLQPWRQIPTTPENDACVSSDLVTGLLNQRDISRREKDFRTADALLEEARTSPDGDLNLRIHDESRTWRVWTEAPPAHHMQTREDRDPRLSAAEQCFQIVEEHAPHKVDEIKMVLEKFKGREFQVLKRLKNQYES